MLFIPALFVEVSTGAPELAMALLLAASCQLASLAVPCCLTLQWLSQPTVLYGLACCCCWCCPTAMQLPAVEAANQSQAQLLIECNLSPCQKLPLPCLLSPPPLGPPGILHLHFQQPIDEPSHPPPREVGSPVVLVECVRVIAVHCVFLSLWGVCVVCSKTHLMSITALAWFDLSTCPLCML